MPRLATLLLLIGSAATAAEDPAAPGAASPTAGAAAVATPEPTPEATEEAMEAEAYSVKGSRLGATATKMNIPLYQVPATVNVVDEKTLREQGARQWTQALYNVPGVFTVAQGPFVGASVRGLSSNNLVVLYDGVRDDTTQFASTAPFSSLEDMERVEFLKGPSSIIYGQGAIGGAVNFIRRKPSRQERYELSTGLDSFNSLRTAFGAQGGLPLGMAYRFDTAVNQVGTFQGSKDQLSKATLSLDAPLWDGAEARFIGTLSRDRFQEIGNTTGSIPTDAGGRIRPGTPRNRIYVTPNSRLEYDAFNLQLELSQRLGENWRLSNTLSYLPAYYVRFQNNLTLQALPSNMITRTWRLFGTERRPLQDSLSLNGELEALGKHQMMLSYDFQDYTQYQLRYDGVSGTNCPVCPAIPAIDLYNPVDNASPLPNRPRFNHQTATRQQANGVYAQEFYEPLPWLKALLGVRHDSWNRAARGESLNRTGAPDVSVAEPTSTTAVSATTYRAGLILEPLEGFTLYAAQSTSFRPNFQTTSWDGRTTFDPENGEMLEIGSKLDWYGGRLSASTAYFDIMKYNVLVNLGAHPSGLGSIFATAGAQRSQGFEVESRAETADGGWAIRGGYAYVYSSYLSFVQNPNDPHNKASNFSGNRTAWAPIHTVTLWGSRRLSQRVKLNLGGRYMDEVFVTDANLTPLPGYWLANAGLSCQLEGADLILNIDNVFDRQDHFTSGDNTTLAPGAPRAISATYRQVF